MITYAYDELLAQRADEAAKQGTADFNSSDDEP